MSEIHGYPWVDVGITIRHDIYPDESPLAVLDRVELYLDFHPDASVPQILGRFLFDPSYAPLVVDIIEHWEKG